MNYLSKNCRARYSFSLLHIFSLTKRRSSLLSTFDADPNEQPILVPKYKPHLVFTGDLTQSPPLDRRDFEDIASSHRLITSYIRSGDLGSALKVFDHMNIRTTVTWNSILAGYAKKPGKMEEAQKLFDEIPEPDAFSYNTMLVCYVNNFGATCAMEFFDKIPVKDAVTWNTMISGFSREKKMGRARELFDMMPKKNGVSWNAMVAGYVGSGDLESAEKLFESGPVKSVVAWTAMIDGYMKTGAIESAETLFARMAEKNVVTWSAMISGYIENRRPEEGLKLFRGMLGSGVEPNPSCLSSVFLSCSNLSALQMGEQVHSRVRKSPVCNDTTTATSIVSMYCKCGALEDARKLFLEVRVKDVVLWNAMITGCAKHGAGQEALALFRGMRRGGTRPDWITLVAVLLACNHSGLVDFGVRSFESMVRDHGIEPRPEHYTCMVDLLGRAGRLSEAVELIKKMPFEPGAPVFGALLGACRLKKDWELAEYAAKNLLRVDQSSAGAYVQLANVYASTRKWDRVSEVWRSMKQARVVKEPGYSWIEVRGSVHEFRSGDRVHPEIVSIHDNLAELQKEMKILGYVPELDSALCDSDICFREPIFIRAIDR